MTDTLQAVRIQTPLGDMLAAASGDALCFLEFTDPQRIERQLKRLGAALNAEDVAAAGYAQAAAEAADAADAPDADHAPERGIIARVQYELAEYFAGRLRTFTVPLAPAGTPFQQQVWQMLTTIPYGTTRSYAEQAHAIGRPTATRAVAHANGDNAIAIIIPCHRVIGSNGKLTGYGGGLWRKQWLLDHERGGDLWHDASS